MGKVVYFSISGAGDPARTVALVRDRLKPQYVDRLFPTSHSPATNRRFYAEFPARGNIGDWVRKLRALPNVSEVEPAEERYLM